jgi:hypothetical protein
MRLVIDDPGVQPVDVDVMLTWMSLLTRHGENLLCPLKRPPITAPMSRTVKPAS